MDIAIEAVRQGDMNELVKAFNFSSQLYTQQEEAYQRTLRQIEDCR